jgi:hypothetical protein
MEDKIFLGHYRVRNDDAGQPIDLGSGPAGVIYRGEEMGSGQEVIIELVPCAALEKGEQEELETEAVAAKQLNHVNIPRLLDFGVEEDHLFYVSESFGDGTTADAWVKDHGPMSAGPVLRVALQVVGALGAANFYRIIHPAINPGNLLIVPGQTAEGDWPLVKVLHFIGIAPAFSESALSGSDPTEAAKFASPEQLQHGKVDFRSEIYSLGSTMWFLLTGAPLLIDQADSFEVRQIKMRLAIGKLSGIPKSVRRLLGQMLSVSPDERPNDPLALYEQLRDCLLKIERREAMARKFGIPALPRHPQRERKARTAIPLKPLALAAALIALAALAILALPERLRPGAGRHANTRTKPIGVPVGVPDAEASAAPIVAAVEQDAQSTRTESNRDVTNSASGQTAVSTETTGKPATPAAPRVAAANRTGKKAPPASQPENAPAVDGSGKPAVAVANDVSSAPQSNEAAAPGEGPADAASRSAAPSEPQTRPATQTARNRDAESTAPDSTGSTSDGSRGTEATSAAAAKSESKTKNVAKSASVKPAKPRQIAKAEVEDENGPPLERGSVRAHFVGTTPEGLMILEMPSGRMVVVPNSSARRHGRQRAGEPAIREGRMRVLPAQPPDEEGTLANPIRPPPDD